MSRLFVLTLVFVSIMVILSPKICLAQRVLQVHVDLNGTLLIPVRRTSMNHSEPAWFGPGTADQNKVLFQRTGGEGYLEYRAAEGAGEFIASILDLSRQFPQFELEIFVNTRSHPNTAKNKLDKIYVPGTGGESVLSLLSKDRHGNEVDRVIVKPEDEAKGDKKDLRVSRANREISDTIYVADKRFKGERQLVEGQERHWLEIDMRPIFEVGGRYGPVVYLESGRDLGIEIGTEIDDIKDAELREKAKALVKRKRSLEYARGMIQLAVLEMIGNPDLKFVEALERVQKRDFTDERVYELGAKQFRRVNPHYRSPGLFPTCARRIEALL
jgi:hypothetical protein